MPGEEMSSLHKEIIEGLATLKQVTTDILVQTTKTNGRVTKLEETVATHSAKILLNDAVDAAALVKANWWKDKLGTAMIGLVFAAGGALLLLILQKTEIVDISVVSSAEYDTLDALTSSYENNSR